MEKKLQKVKSTGPAQWNWKKDKKSTSFRNLTSRISLSSNSIVSPRTRELNFLEKVTDDNIKEIFGSLLEVLFPDDTEMRNQYFKEIIAKSNSKNIKFQDLIEKMARIRTLCKNQTVYIKNIESPLMCIQSLIRRWNIERNLSLIPLSNGNVWINFIEEEKHYIEQLESIIECYKIPIMNRVQLSQFSQTEMTSQDIEVLFFNLDNILETTRVLYDKLILHHQHYPIIFGVGQTFLNFIPSMLEIYEEYLKNLPAMLESWLQLEKETLISGFLIAAQATSKFPDTKLTDLLKLPAHRIVRYEEVIFGLTMQLARSILTKFSVSHKSVEDFAFSILSPSQIKTKQTPNRDNQDKDINFDRPPLRKSKSHSRELKKKISKKKVRRLNSKKKLVSSHDDNLETSDGC